MKNICKGSVTHGTGCNVCISCQVELEKLHSKRPVSFLVREDDLDHWASVADDPQFQEIIRLARTGLWAERYEGHVITALTTEMGKQSRGRISPFERALDAYPNRKKR